ncbi:MAG: virulence RhuM family protein [Nitrosomonas sp.]|nr:virulence RhuM family protein [Nitrosomonas sp.]MDR4521739.1 virulence RhuM family protein [Nitrosomonas sp.]
MNVKAIVDMFGGQTALATLIGKGQSTVAYWVKSESIPARWHPKLLILASQHGIKLSANDFIECPVIEDHQIQPIERPEYVADTDIHESVDSSAFMFYAAQDGAIKIQVLLGEETVWASQQGMADIFDIESNTVTYHLKNIFDTNELSEYSTTRKFRVVQREGNRNVSREIDFYNLDAIISVGYRVNSYKATQFRKWATSVLKEYLVKGFALDDDRLKQGNKLFGKDYFDELIERIRRIRTSERMFWQKVTDLYSQCSVDYDKNATVTQSFFAQVQNKFHYAIHHHTAAELVKERADATKPNMGLVHYANMHKDGMILKTDVPIGKNYLTPEELDELERLVENYLGTAELFAKRKIVMTMKDWVNKLDEFLRFNAYDVLEGSGKVSGDSAKKHALTEYEKFMAVHEKEFISDFDKFVDEVKIKKRLPT